MEFGTYARPAAPTHRLQRTVCWERESMIARGDLFSACLDPVVGSERRSVGPYPFAVDVSLYRVSLKVMSTCLFFLWNHVHVCLQNHRLAVFHAGCGGLAHNDVASLVFKCFNACVFCEVEQELLNFLQMS